MAKAQAANTFQKKPKVRRPGVHAKTKSSCSKNSRNYIKLSKGQG
jgi:hypothetical protein